MIEEASTKVLQAGVGIVWGMISFVPK